MAKKQKIKKQNNGQRVSKKQERFEARAKENRMKQIRIIGFAALVVVAIAALVLWRNAGRVTADEAAALVTPNVFGPENAPVKIVEFGDFGCPSCRAWHNSGIKDQLLADYGEQISFEFRHFPVITAQSPKAAEAAQCAAEQDAFWQYHDYIYEQTPQNALSIANLQQYALDIGLDGSQFNSCLDSGKFDEYVIRDMRAAQAAGARGTPTFLIDNRQVAFSYASMAAAIEAAK